jgi:hypothetical protein
MKRNRIKYKNERMQMKTKENKRRGEENEEKLENDNDGKLKKTTDIFWSNRSVIKSYRSVSRKIKRNFLPKKRTC